MSLEEYYEKRKAAQVQEATELVRLYRERYGKEPDEKALHEFFWLFSDNPNELSEIWKSMNRLCGNEEYTNEVMKKHKKQFESIDEFLNSTK